MIDSAELLARQARWQHSRGALSWPEKIRLVEAIRESVLRWRAEGGRGELVGRETGPAAASTSGHAPPDARRLP